MNIFPDIPNTNDFFKPLDFLEYECFPGLPENHEIREKTRHSKNLAAHS